MIGGRGNPPEDSGPGGRYLPGVGLAEPAVLQLVDQRDPAVAEVRGHRVGPGQQGGVAYLVPPGVRQGEAEVHRSLGLNWIHGFITITHSCAHLSSQFYFHAAFIDNN